MSNYRKIASLTITISLLIAFGANLAFGGKGKSSQPPIPLRARDVFLGHPFPYDAQDHTVVTVIRFVNVKDIKSFAIRSFEARDQDGNLCPFDNVYVGFAKGGQQVRIFTKIESDIFEKVIVKGEIVLNDDVVEFTVGYQKSPTAGQTDYRRKDWYYIDELEEFKVSERSRITRSTPGYAE